MSSIQRTLEQTIVETSRMFRVLLLTGPRQVGKTTLLRMIDSARRHYVSLDDMNLRRLAQEDPVAFIARLPLPVLIDEVQYAPQLFSAIKMVVDERDEPGLFWLTGSQQFEMMQNVSETLAGRVAILKLQGISLAEELGCSRCEPFVPESALLQARESERKPLSLQSVYHKIWRGSYPEVVVHDGKNWARYYESYVATYIQRDIRDYLRMHDPSAFMKFMQMVAARTGQLLNYRDLSNDVGVSQVTIKSWFDALHASGVIYLLQPYFNNQNKRLVKTPKCYFMDTGLCAFLTGWLNEDVLERGAMSGAFLETYVVSEIIKSYIHRGEIPQLFFYRDRDKREIDLLIQKNHIIHPIEIKKSAVLRKQFIKHFDALSANQITVGHGAVIGLTDRCLPMGPHVDAVPVGYI